LDNIEIQNSRKIADMLNNRFLSITIDDFINQPQVVDKLEQDLEKSYKAISRLESKYGNDEKSYDAISDLSNSILKMQNQLSDFRLAEKKED
jgi:hypothetical protein